MYNKIKRLEDTTMFDTLMTSVCNAIASGLTSIANVATNSVSLFLQYEHEMPKCLKK